MGLVMNRGITRVMFSALLLLSGFAGIAYEVLYARLLGNLIGDQWLVSASVLLTFLLGIGAGTWYAHRWWPHLWLIELGVGLYAAAFALGMGHIESWLYASGALFGQSLAGQLTQCVLLLSAPAFLVGAALPLYAGYFARLWPGRAFARAYGLHSLGAALTVLLMEFGLLRLLGLEHTVLFTAMLNSIVGLILILAFPGLRRNPPLAEHYHPCPKRSLLALALVSVASAICQLWLLSVAEFVIGPFRETFALLLAIVLFGIALGAAIVRRWQLSFSVVVAINLFGLIWAVGLFDQFSTLYAVVYPVFQDSHLAVTTLKLTFLFLLAAPMVVSFGATIPALITEERHVARESGQLLFVSSLANACGFLLMIFVLHPYLDFGVMILVVFVFSALALIIYLRARILPVLGVSVVALTALGLHQVRWDERLLYVGHTAFTSSEELDEKRQQLSEVEVFKGQREVFALSHTPDGNSFFFLNGYVSFYLNSPAEQLVGAFSAMLAPRTDHALLLGTGSGASAGTVDLLFEHTDAVEINPLVISNLPRMAEYNFRVYESPRVNFIEDDGIHYIKTSKKQYSLILNTVTSPHYFSSAKLYTRDFLELARQRLTPDGVYLTWFDSRVGDRGADIILRTLGEVFANCWLGYVKENYHLAACSAAPLHIHHPRIAVDQPVLRDHLLKRYGVLAEWLPYGVLSTHVLSLLKDKSVPLNTLDYPALEFEIATQKSNGYPDFKKRLLSQMNFDEMRKVLSPVAEWGPLPLALHAEIVLNKQSSYAKRWQTILSGELPGFAADYQTLRMDYARYYAQAADTALAYQVLGEELFMSHDYEPALEALQEALRRNPENPRSHFYLGASYEALGAFDQALAAYRRERELYPEHELALEGIARVHLGRDEPAQALAALDQINDAAEGDSALYFRAISLLRLNRLEEARASALRISLDSPLYQEAQRHLNGSVSISPEEPVLVEYRKVHEEADGGADSSVSPDGKWISFSHSKSGNLEVYAVHTETGEIRNLTNTPDDEWEGRWGPDGKHIVFTGVRNRQNGVFIRNLETGEETTIMSTLEGYEDYPSFSKDGRMVSFTAGPMGSREVYTWNWDTGKVSVLTRGHKFVGATNFSADGTKVVYHAYYGGSYNSEKADIFVVDVNGGIGNNITHNNDVWVYKPQWSPDGKWIVFSARYDTPNFNLWVMRPDGSQRTKITDVANEDLRWADWTTDGRLAWHGIKAQHGRLYGIDVETGAKHEMASGEGFVRSLAPSPDGSMLVYELRGDIFVTDAEPGSTPLLLAEGTEPRFSADGKTVSYVRNRRSRLGVVPVTGGEPTIIKQQVAERPTSTSNGLSPDGAKMAMINDANELVVITRDGMKRALTSDGQPKSAPVWSHDGRYIFYSESQPNRVAYYMTKGSVTGQLNRVNTEAGTQ